ncbi:hypothetical protein HYH02_010675 [Chlamydomonas schloesseri]|uniref:Uncharacterized protein n=1 Tax=Chlamydomonas schloesseri TaxID=2026947 RepID=A0A835T4N9_9CHLO|nr:hypothetical protein HYH02_010675 [Chlamydomonas schloesseri]|eukprot:KAG2438877.1 hypothetical protein HYH02_010675 [Chlamydomonas schloesseri]
MDRASPVSPLDKFPHCTSLSIRVALDCDDSVGLALIGVSPVARQRITRLAVVGTINPLLNQPYQLDPVRIVQSVAALLPALEDLEFSGLYWKSSAGHKARHALLFNTIASAHTRLRSLTLPLPHNGYLHRLGALGAVPLRRLVLQPGVDASTSVLLTQGLLDDLTQLQQLEELTVHVGGECPLDSRGCLGSLLGSRRPPNVRSIHLTAGRSRQPAVEVSYGAGGAPAAGGSSAACKGVPTAGAGAKALTGGQGPISSVAVRVDRDVGATWLPRAEDWAGTILAAAHSLEQRSIPEIVFDTVCVDDMLGAGSLPRLAPRLAALLMRCERVELRRLRLAAAAAAPGVTGALLRLLRALPRRIELHHGEWNDIAVAAPHPGQQQQQQQQQQSHNDENDAASGDGAAAVAAADPSVSVATTGAGPKKRKAVRGSMYTASKRRELQRKKQEQQQARAELGLATATAEDVLRQAVDRLWALAAAGAGAGEGSAGAGPGGSSRSSSSSGGGEGSTGGGSSCIVVLKGKLPAAPKFAGSYLEWSHWGETALDALLGSTAQPPRPPRQPAVRPPHKRSVGAAGKPITVAAAKAAARAAEQAAAYTAARKVAQAATRCRQLLLPTHHMPRQPVAVPSAGLLLVECNTPADASALVALVSQAQADAVAAGAHMARGGGRLGPRVTAALVPPPSGLRSSPSCKDVLQASAFEVLRDFWARSTPLADGGSSCSGGSGAAGSSVNAAGRSAARGSAATSVLTAAGAAAPVPAATAPPSDELLGRLEKLMALDEGVTKLWRSFYSW